MSVKKKKKKKDKKHFHFVLLLFVFCLFGLFFVLVFLFLLSSFCFVNNNACTGVIYINPCTGGISDIYLRVLTDYPLFLALTECLYILVVME